MTNGSFTLTIYVKPRPSVWKVCTALIISKLGELEWCELVTCVSVCVGRRSSECSRRHPRLFRAHHSTRHSWWCRPVPVSQWESCWRWRSNSYHRRRMWVNNQSIIQWLTVLKAGVSSGTGYWLLCCSDLCLYIGTCQWLCRDGLFLASPSEITWYPRKGFQRCWNVIYCKESCVHDFLFSTLVTSVKLFVQIFHSLS